jgi:NAD(P)H dehydrogenase (quinone)
MAQMVVVVTFYSRSGATERLATAAAVGAVQARAGIRMRRLPDVDPATTLERFPSSREHLARMEKEYVPPREADILAADVLVLGTPTDLTATSAEWGSFFTMLEKLRDEGKLRGKVVAVVGESVPAAFTSAVERLGLTAVAPRDPMDGGGTPRDEIQRAVSLGREAVAVAEGFKQKRQS